MFCTINLYGWSNSPALPSDITQILSTSIIVANLCAMIRTVQSSNFSLSLDWIRLSVSRSTLAVASSSTNILVFLMIALTKQTNCFWPTENKLLLSLQYVLKPSLRDAIFFSSWTSLMISFIYLSDNSLNGSRFSLIVPYNKKGVWGMKAILCLSWCKPTSLVSTSSIQQEPSLSSTNLNRAYKIELLPAPVRPTIPTLMPG